MKGGSLKLLEPCSDSPPSAAQAVFGKGACARMQQALMWTAAGTGFTFFMTALGAASVFVFRKKQGDLAQRVFLGFAAGVMSAA